MKKKSSKPIRIGILHLRGGLGNQLFQLSALAYYSKSLNFQPLIYDHDLTLVKRDHYFPQYQYFCFRNLFLGAWPPIVLTRFWRFIIRQLLKLPIRNLVLNQQTMDRLVREGGTPPFIFFIRDSFEDDFFVSTLSSIDISKTLSFSDPSPIIRQSEVAIHIRISGYGEMSDDEKENLYRISEHLVSMGVKTIDIYTDSISALIESITLKQGLLVNWPEREIELSPPMLLQALSNYRILITNGSSIARWANYFSLTKQEQVFINFKKSTSYDSHLQKKLGFSMSLKWRPTKSKEC